MALIVFFIDIEEGHLFPSFGLARSLLSAGHEVVYISVPDNEKHVRKQGFPFYPIFEKNYPRGVNLEIKNKLRVRGYKQEIPLNCYFDDFLNYEYRDFFCNLRPDLVIMSWVLCLEALILHYRWQLDPILLSPNLRPPQRDIVKECLETLMEVSGDRVARLIDFHIQLGYTFRSLADFIRPATHFDEIVLCPRELEIERGAVRSNVYYLGPTVTGRVNGDDTAWLGPIAKTRKVIYACLGTQSITYGHTKDRCFNEFIKMMQLPGMGDWHLILSIGDEEGKVDLSNLPGNVTVVKWIEQMEVLKIASVAIIHGGLGTIKECIYYGVPMIVLPFIRDQPLNAKRIEYHRLGIVHDAERVSAEELAGSVQAILGRCDIKFNLSQMQVLFREKDAADPGISVVEKILDQRKKA